MLELLSTERVNLSLLGIYCVELANSNSSLSSGFVNLQAAPVVLGAGNKATTLIRQRNHAVTPDSQSR